MPFCDYLATRLIGIAFEGSAWTQVIGTYLALWIGDPGVLLLGGREVYSIGGYARATIGIGAWTSDVEGNAENTAAITFPEATLDWTDPGSPVTHVVIYGDQGAGAVPWLVGALTVAKEITEGSIPQFAAGDLRISFI
jgi:hypothetical protein